MKYECMNEWPGSYEVEDIQSIPICMDLPEEKDAV